MAYSTIWMVAEEPAHRTVLTHALHRIHMGRHVQEFASCVEALSVASERAPDLLLIDIDRSNWESIPRFKALWPAADFVAITALDDAETLRRAIGAGAVGVLHKDAPSGEIAFCLRQLGGVGASVTSCFMHKLFELVAAASASPKDISLSRREGEVMDLLAQGRAKKEIADLLGLSGNTVDTYIRRIYGKLKVRSRGAAVAKAMRLGWRCPF